VGRATLTAVKSLAITTTAIPIAKSASQLVFSGLAMAAAYAKVRRRMDRRFDSLALLLLLPPRGE
jgi:hypothetical protein